MKESLSRVTTPAPEELPLTDPSLPEAANDNEVDLTHTMHPEAANDNDESQPISTIYTETMPTVANDDAERIAAVKESLHMHSLGAVNEEMMEGEESVEDAVVAEAASESTPSEKASHEEESAKAETGGVDGGEEKKKGSGGGGGGHGEGGGAGVVSAEKAHSSAGGHGEEKKKGPLRMFLGGLFKWLGIGTLAIGGFILWASTTLVKNATGGLMNAMGVKGGGGGGSPKKPAGGGGGGGHH